MGGIFHQTQARALVRLGLDVTVASPTPRAPWPVSRLRSRWQHYASAPRTAVDDGVKVIRPRYLGVPREPSWARPDRLIAETTWAARSDWAGAQLVHGHSVVAGLAAWRIANWAGRPLVLTFHGSDLNVWPDRHPERLADLRSAIRAAAAVVTVSAALAARVAALADVEAIHLPLGSDHRLLAAAAVPHDEARDRLGLVDDRVVVLFVGNLLEEKGVRELADAILARADRFLGVFVGDGPERGYGSAHPRAADSLSFRGMQPHDEVARYMSAADVLVLPSFREGLPTVLVEAGSLGLPVVASAVGGIPSLVGDDRGALLRNVSAEAVGDALDAFAARRREADAAAGRLREFVYAQHDVDINAGRLLAIYNAAGMNAGLHARS